jgi:hypothetical protein
LQATVESRRLLGLTSANFRTKGSDRESGQSEW